MGGGTAVKLWGWKVTMRVHVRINEYSMEYIFFNTNVHTTGLQLIQIWRTVKTIDSFLLTIYFNHHNYLFIIINNEVLKIIRTFENNFKFNNQSKNKILTIYHYWELIREEKKDKIIVSNN